jgi:hypothetical protein
MRRSKRLVCSSVSILRRPMFKTGMVASRC